MAIWWPGAEVQLGLCLLPADHVLAMFPCRWSSPHLWLLEPTCPRFQEPLGGSKEFPQTTVIPNSLKGKEAEVTSTLALRLIPSSFIYSINMRKEPACDRLALGLPLLEAPLPPLPGRGSWEWDTVPRTPL